MSAFRSKRLLKNLTLKPRWAYDPKFLFRKVLREGRKTK